MRLWRQLTLVIFKTLGPVCGQYVSRWWCVVVGRICVANQRFTSWSALCLRAVPRSVVLCCHTSQWLRQRNRNRILWACPRHCSLFFLDTVHCKRRAGSLPQRLVLLHRAWLVLTCLLRMGRWCHIACWGQRQLFGAVWVFHVCANDGLLGVLCVCACLRHNKSGGAVCAG